MTHLINWSTFSGKMTSLRKEYFTKHTSRNACQLFQTQRPDSYTSQILAQDLVNTNSKIMMFSLHNYF